MRLPPSCELPPFKLWPVMDALILPWQRGKQRFFSFLFLVLFPLCQTWAAESISPEEASVLAEQVTRDMIELFTECSLVGLVVYVQEDNTIGLLKEPIETAARNMLRRARFYKDQPKPVGGILIVNVMLMPEDPIFTYRVWFEKRQLDQKSHISGWSPTGWIKWGYGRHGGDVTYVLSVISSHLDQFLDDYLRANEPACDPEPPEWREITLEEMGLPADYNPFPDESE